MKKILMVLCGLAVSLAVPAGEDPAAEAADADVQDVLYTGEGRPALIRLHVRVDGRPLFARWDGYIEKFFRYLDRNGSGSLDRLEAGRAFSALQMQVFFQGRLAARVTRERGRENLSFEALDADKDGRVTLDELRDYYRKNGAGPVQLTAQPVYAGGPDALSDTLFKLLDGDGDGKLTKAEVAQAARLLARYDSNDDELVSQQELGGAGPYQAQQLVRTMTAPAAGTLSSLVLIAHEDGGRRMTGRLSIARDLLTRLDKDRDNRLSLTESGFPEELFARLDRNKDGKLDTLELVRWLGGKPDGEFDIRLGTGEARAKRPGQECREPCPPCG